MKAVADYTDAHLLQDLAAGNKSAFEVIYKRHFISLYHFARGFVANTQKAEDITTDTFLKLWERLSQFSTLHGIKSFLFTTAKNACLNEVRSESRETARHEAFVAMNSDDGFDEPVVSRAYQYIYDEIEKLPEDTKRVFKMAYLEGMDNEAIAEVLGLTNQSVRNYKYRALKILRSALSDRDTYLFFLAWLASFR